MNAGSSETGEAFAMRNCDAFFTATRTSRHGVDAMARMVADIKSKAQALGREIEVFTIGQIVCRATQKEAEDYYRHAMLDMADWVSLDGMLQVKGITPKKVGDEEYRKQREYLALRGIGGYPFVGTPDSVAAELATLSGAGVRGIAFSMVNYLRELPFLRDEVLPRLQRIGVRA
jgi:alkanesulfonate monooxygenase SsuD/methylene tetrahydromethanopterin reductase-like flavin-dependent oxidoreductase (luciferase family)